MAKKYSNYRARFLRASLLLRTLYVIATIIFLIGLVDLPNQIRRFSITSIHEIRLIPYRIYSIGCLMHIERMCIKKQYSIEFVTKGDSDALFAVFEPVIQEQYNVEDTYFPHPSYKKILDTLLIEGFLVKNMKVFVTKGSMWPNWDKTMKQCNGDTDCYHNEIIYDTEGLITLETIVDNISERKMVFFNSEIQCHLTEGIGYKCGDYMLGEIVNFYPRVIVCESSNRPISTIKKHCI